MTELTNFDSSAAKADEILRPLAQNERIFKRLRWIMLGTIIVDAINTFWGQPRSYCTNPSTAHEHNTFVRFFAKLGYQPFILYWIVYTIIALLIVSRVPRRFSLIAVFAFILPHYFGATSWWVYSWGFGQNAATVYGFALAIALGMSFVSKDTDSNPQ